MKFSKKMMAVAVLVSTQAVVLFGLPQTRGTTTATRPAPVATRPVVSKPVEGVKLVSSMSSTENLLRYMSGLIEYLRTPIANRTSDGLNKALDITDALWGYLKKDQSRMRQASVDEEDVADLFGNEKVGPGENPIWDTPVSSSMSKAIVPYNKG